MLVCHRPPSDSHFRKQRFPVCKNALPGRLELPTLRLTASRSDQLSYGSDAAGAMPGWLLFTHEGACPPPAQTRPVREGTGVRLSRGTAGRGGRRRPRSCEDATVVAQARQDAGVGTRRASLHTWCIRCSAAGQRERGRYFAEEHATRARRARPPNRRASWELIATKQCLAEWGGLTGRTLDCGPSAMAAKQRGTPSFLFNDAARYPL